MERLRRFFRDTHAGIAIEYALIAAIVSLSLILGAEQIGSALSAVYNSVATAFEGA
ncbi:Flp family type IVb pilin [Ensifer sp. 2YAB10]|jgi:pilus assembly protein Flp/PilA|uniref:Flp family type IVb pilin n=1 Tax=Ensifer TaxID=106591 RepID=UPI000DE31CC5|nr:MULTISPECIES: Flp family type IVb pilin [Ensifer]MBK5567196.1 Flp family type IVb pilin [Ensifer sp. SSB1]MBZ7922994.1 Flp family type IVb pilin [Ensifer adhaerens]UAX91589.1 Flp family type IVb pilin [Ensifer adhaerens]UAX99217.1 Flp family type IVb pilin [Ensifer adhaerens]UAY06600.1 Flp family type IVb pilin [Ensifer adhaerens]